MLELIYTSTKLVDADYLIWGDPSNYPLSLFYINDIDAMIMVQDTPSGQQRIYKVFRDGTILYTGRITPTSYDPFSISRGRMGWVGGYPTYTLYMSDEIAFLPLPMQEVASGFVRPVTYSGEIRGYLDLFKRLYVYSNLFGKIICANTVTSSSLWSFTPETKYIGSYRYNYVDLDHIMITGSSTYSYNKSYGILVNINTGAVVSTVEFLYSLMSVYDCNHGIFITISTDRIVRIYVNDYYPYSFGPIIPEHYGLFTYVGQDIKVQLTSIGGFPCSDRLVTWYLPTGLGSLEKAVSVTDANGYAWNYYYGPLTAGGLETITVGWG